ncbi:MAG: lycopene beta-cyclase CrtY [Myxococcales bacterium]|nr:lycopene beta-cyclase CrtY [Myxococcales bacterium]
MARVAYFFPKHPLRQSSKPSSLRLALVGGGLHNGLLSLMFLSRHPQAQVTIFESSVKVGGNHTWCFYQADCPIELFVVLRPYLSDCWSGTDVKFATRQRTLHQPYYRLTSSGLVAALSDLQLRSPTFHILTDCTVTCADEFSVTTREGTVHRADIVVDSRGPDAMAQHFGPWQVFLGQHVKLSHPHGMVRPLVIDARVDQNRGLRFVYVLPLADDQLLIEDTYFVEHADLAASTLRSRIAEYAKQHHFDIESVISEESGRLPLTLGGTDPSSAMDPVRGGYAGGWFHPITGYSFPLAARFACLLSESETRNDFAEALTRLAVGVKSQNKFLFALNRTLYEGFLPKHRIGVLEHFYRVPEELISRFYSASLTPVDRIRVFLGMPPKHVRWLSLAHATWTR